MIISASVRKREGVARRDLSIWRARARARPRKCLYGVTIRAAVVVVVVGRAGVSYYA